MTSRIFIGGIVKETTERDIEEPFAQFGRISKVSVKDGYAFVDYEDKGVTEKAIETLDGSLLRGSKIHVEPSRGRETKCFICGLPGHR